jgi:hypothetical protein
MLSSMSGYSAMWSDPDRIAMPLTCCAAMSRHLAIRCGEIARDQGEDLQARTCVLAAPQAPELYGSFHPPKQRAQGMPGEGLTHGPRATKKHAAEPQVKPIIRHSLRGGFNAYT